MADKLTPCLEENFSVEEGTYLFLRLVKGMKKFEIVEEMKKMDIREEIIEKCIRGNLVKRLRKCLEKDPVNILEFIRRWFNRFK